MKLLVFAAFLAVAAPLPLGAEQPLVIRKKENVSVRNEVQIAIDKGLAFLKSQQQADGSWEKQPTYPAMTAYPLLAFRHDPKRRYLDRPDFLERGYAVIRKNAKPDGRISIEECALANTAICMMALLENNDPKDAAAIQAARGYLGTSQTRNGALQEMEGGYSYGDEVSRQSSDLHNTVVVLEAIRLHRDLRPDEKVGEHDLDWNAAMNFVTRCQNLRSQNKSHWASDDPANKGGFIYMPGYSSAGDMEVTRGERRVPRSYGSMGYAGLLCLMYGDTPKDDLRLEAAVAWLTRNFTVDENPGMKRSGLFLYYHLMAKGLAAAKLEELKLPDGRSVDAPQALAAKLLELQKSDGSWLNDNGRWLENDPALATSYAVIALEVLHDLL